MKKIIICSMFGALAMMSMQAVADDWQPSVTVEESADAYWKRIMLGSVEGLPIVCDPVTKPGDEQCYYKGWVSPFVGERPVPGAGLNADGTQGVNEDIRMSLGKSAER